VLAPVVVWEELSWKLDAWAALERLLDHLLLARRAELSEFAQKGELNIQLERCDRVQLGQKAFCNYRHSRVGGEIAKMKWFPSNTVRSQHFRHLNKNLLVSTTRRKSKSVVVSEALFAYGKNWQLTKSLVARRKHMSYTRNATRHSGR